MKDIKIETFKQSSNDTNDIVFGLLEGGVNLGFSICKTMCVCMLILIITLITVLILALTDVI